MVPYIFSHSIASYQQNRIILFYFNRKHNDRIYFPVYKPYKSRFYDVSSPFVYREDLNKFASLNLLTFELVERRVASNQ